MSRLASWLRRRDPFRVDLVLAAVMVAELELELALVKQPVFIAAHIGVQAGSAVLYGAPIAVRRRWPGGALVFLGAVAVVQAAMGAYLIDALVGTTIPPVVLAYGVGSRLEFRRALLALGAGIGSFWVAVLLSDVLVAPPQHSGFGSDVAVMGALIIGPWLAGRLARERRKRAEAFRRLAAQANAERQHRAQAAIAEERMRIGRELQDIIIHSVSVMVVQAGGARRTLRTEPGPARESILAVEHTGRDALADMRRLLGMLRKDEDPRALTPQPGLVQVGPLLDSLRSEGLDCRLETTGERVALTPGVDLVGYRVIEAGVRLLAARGATSATVSVGYGPAWLELGVESDVPSPGSERELEAVRERVALYDGLLELRQDEAFSLSARLPLTQVAVV